MAHAATMLQSRIRGYLHRIKMERDAEEGRAKNEAATSIESGWRRFRAHHKFVRAVSGEYNVLRMMPSLVCFIL
jgi:hypothetical protein